MEKELFLEEHSFITVRNLDQDKPQSALKSSNMATTTAQESGTPMEE